MKNKRKHGINWIDINDIKIYMFTYFLDVVLLQLWMCRGYLLILCYLEVNSKSFKHNGRLLRVIIVIAVLYFQWLEI